MTNDPRLVSLKISPWSERARWALDHHRLAYQVIDHVPFLGERKLRRLVGPRKERATVPVLITDEETITESWDIARYADREGSGTKLIPSEKESEIRRWNDLADATMEAGRGLVMGAMVASPQAVLEGLPRNVPRWLRPMLRPVALYGTKWFVKKYGLRLDEGDAQRAKLRAAFETLRAEISKGSDYLLGSFCYADMVMAICLQGVAPVAGAYLRLGPATRSAWTDDRLAKEFSDLIAWRDRLYVRHRRAEAHLDAAQPMGVGS